LLLLLDAEGIAASTGSACTSGSLEASHVLTAMGLPATLARSSLRLTLGRGTTPVQVARVLTVLPNVVERLRVLSPLASP
jgi:cysteine desulfurase